MTRPRLPKTTWLGLAAVALLVLLLALPAFANAEEEEGETANPAQIAGVVTQVGGAKVRGAEVCAFDVAEDEAFEECATTGTNGAYEIQGLDEGNYDVSFKTGGSGLNLVQQFWKGATTVSKAGPVWAAEAKTTTGINAEMQVGPGGPGAANGVEFGDSCVASRWGGTSEGTNFEISREGTGGLPTASPIAGVLTKWIVTSTPTGQFAGPNMEARVVRYFSPTKVGVGPRMTGTLYKPGRNEFESQITIEKGYHLGLSSDAQAYAPECEGFPAGHAVTSGRLEDPLHEAEEMSFGTVKLAVPVIGVVEPDEDGDGFGDATQDECPQSAAFHTACPTVSFGSAYSVGAAAIKVKVRSSAATPVSVIGASPGPGILQAKKKLARGKSTTFKVPIPQPLATRLGRLSPSRSLHVRLRAHATAVDGVPSTDHLWVRLPGRG